MDNWSVRIGSWKDGDPFVVERYDGHNSVSAIQHLHVIGQLKLYDGRKFAAYAYDGEEMNAILHIYAPSQLSRIEWAGTGSYCQCAQCQRTAETL